MTSNDPRDSATVVLLRDADPMCEVLLVQRHADSRAFGGAHVFPGGVLDRADVSPAVHAVSRMPPAAAAERLGDADPAVALAFWIAAIRELFEETGILLATAGSAPLPFEDGAVRTRFDGHRADLLAGRVAFADIVARERLELATDALLYWSRWITPVSAPRRYDVRFFVARFPPGQQPLHDDRETIASAWLMPRQALAEARAGRMLLAPPTIRTLEELDELGTVARIVAAAPARVVTAILPKPVDVDGRPAVLYPGDADYDTAEPGGRLSDGTRGPRDRMVMEDGGWRSVRTPS